MLPRATTDQLGRSNSPTLTRFRRESGGPAAFSRNREAQFSKGLFLFVLYALHTLERTAGAQPTIHERVEIAVHHRLHVARLDARPQVFDHAIRLEHVAANLVAPRDAAFLAVEPLLLGFLGVLT